MKEIILKYDFGEIVMPFLGDTEYRVVSIQVNMDDSIVYGCADKDGKWEWFKDLEIKAPKQEEKVKGFAIGKVL